MVLFAVHDLPLLRRAALNLMEDALALRQAADQAAEQRDRSRAALEISERTLRVREDELAQAQRIGGLASVNVDVAAGLIGQRSPEYVRLHGLAEGVTQEAHADCLARLHPDDREAAERILMEALNGPGSAYESEYRIIRPCDGEERWLHVRADIHRDPDGRPLRLIGAQLDITQRKRNENALRTSEQKLGAFFTEAPVGISEISPEDRFLKVNATMCSIMGCSEEELPRMGVKDVTHPDDLDVTFEKVAQTLSSGMSCDIHKRYVRPDGTIVFANSAISRQEDEGTFTILAITTDLTVQRRAEQVLQEVHSELERRVTERTSCGKRSSACARDAR